MHQKHKTILTVVGSFLLLIPNCLPWYWGSVSVYALSYIVYTHQSASSVEAPWIISMFLISINISLLSSNLIARFVERRVFILLAILISDSAIFMSYYTIQHSMGLLTFTYSIITGLAMGSLYGNAIFFVIECADRNVGIFTSALQIAFPSGAIIITQLATWYCNPYNKTPDFKLGPTVYFTQTEVLDKVPSLFLVLGAFSLASHASGFILLQFNTEMKSGICSNLDTTSESQPMTGMFKQEIESQHTSSTEEFNAPKDYKPKEVLRSLTFYILWLSFFMNDFTFVLITSYYKLFGQIWIHDDIFLTNLGTAMLFSSIIFRLAWGAGIDRLGLKVGFLCLFGTLSLLGSWYYFTARVNRWLYFTATFLYGGTISSTFACYLAAVAVIYGKTHVSTHFGMVMTASLVFNSIAPVFVKTLLVDFGWFYTFASNCVCNILNLILCLIFIG